MKNPTIQKWLPIANIYLFLSLLFYWLETSVLLNPVALVFFAAFALHYFVAKGAYRLIFPVFFFIINLYMILALLSEFSEFTTFGQEAAMLLAVGGIYLGLNLASAIIIIYSNTIAKIPAEA